MAAINTIIDGIGGAIAGNSVIDTWAKAAYGHGITVYENWDDRDLPGADECPLVVIWPDAKTGGESESPKELAICISCVVHDAAKVTSAAGVIRFTAARNVEKLREYVFDVIETYIGASATDLSIAHVVTEYKPIEQFPFVSVTMQITLTEPKTIGGPLGGPFE